MAELPKLPSPSLDGKPLPHQDPRFRARRLPERSYPHRPYHVWYTHENWQGFVLYQRKKCPLCSLIWKHIVADYEDCLYGRSHPCPVCQETCKGRLSLVGENPHGQLSVCST